MSIKAVNEQRQYMEKVDVSQHVLGREGAYPSMHWAGVCVSQHALPRVVSVQGGVCPGGVSARGGVCPGRGVCPRMVSARGVCPGGCLPKGMCLPRGGVCQGVSAQGALSMECLPRRVSAQGSVYQGGVCPGDVCGRHPPWTEWQTRVKTLPCRNFLAGGKNMQSISLGTQQVTIFL